MGQKKEVVIRNIYSRKLEDLTFNDLEIIGFDNPNTFVKNWSKRFGGFNGEQFVWLIVYSEVEND